MNDPLPLRAGGRLHSVDIGALFRALGEAATGEAPVRLDLGDVGFVTPSGAVWLLAALGTLARRGIAVEVVPPPETKPLHYWLKWMGVYDALIAAGVRCDYPPPKSPLPTLAERRAISQGLLPVTGIRSAGDVALVAQATVGRVGAILEARLGYGRRDVAAIALVLAEACNNIWEHAGDGARGYVAAQLMVRKGAAPYLLVGIADDGRGIRASLGRAHPEAAGWSDEAAVRRALTEGVSGVPDEERGLGLSTVASEIARYRGTLHLRSGAAHLRLKSRNGADPEESVFPSPATIPGTMLCLTFQALP